MNVCREFLSLTVPGLAEGRPLLLLGDKIVASLTGMMHLNAVHSTYLFFYIEGLFFNHIKIRNIPSCTRHCCPYFYPNSNSGSKNLFCLKKNRFGVWYLFFGRLHLAFILYGSMFWLEKILNQLFILISDLLCCGQLFSIKERKR